MQKEFEISKIQGTNYGTMSETSNTENYCPDTHKKNKVKEKRHLPHGLDLG